MGGRTIRGVDGSVMVVPHTWDDIGSVDWAGLDREYPVEPTTPKPTVEARVAENPNWGLY